MKRKKLKHPKLVVGIISTVSVIFLSAAVLLTINDGILTTMASLISGVSDDVSQSPVTSNPESDVSDIPDVSDLPDESEVTEPEQPVEQDIVFARPDQMKGVWLKAGTDYFINGSESGEEVKAQIDAAIAKIAEWSFNSIIIPVHLNGRPLYISDSMENRVSIKNTDGTEFDAPAYLLKCARERGMFTYGVIDLRVNAKDGNDPSTADGAAMLRKMAAEAAARYSFDGWMLENPGYAAGNGGSFSEYMKTMPGIGFDRFLRESITVAATDIIQTIKNVNINLYVGLLAEGVWAHATSEPKGSKTSAVYESLTDGYADTREWVVQGLFDFVMVKNLYSTTNTAAPFGQVLEWWSGLCKENNTPLYISHDSSKVCGTEAGWGSPDQLSQQIIACKNIPEWQGSVFTSFTALKQDSLGSTGALIKAFGGELNEQYISRRLVFNTPAKTTFTTYESKINIRGSADPNFPLTMNGKKVSLSEHGFFSLDFNLSLGLNTYTFSHKGLTVTYRITHKVVVLKSIQPASNMSLDGGTTIGISAEAYKGSNVYAKLGNVTIKMKPVSRQTDESEGKKESDYVNYDGEYTMPAGIINKKQTLGQIMVYGSYKGMNESKTGGSITVKPLPIPDPDDDKPIITGDNSPIDPGIGDKVLKTGQIITVTKNYAETFNGNTTDDWSRPNNAYLPKGTTDVVVKKVVGSNSYYLLGCGRRIYQSNVTTFIKSGKITANKMSDASVSVNTKATNITLDSTWHVPYNLKLLPQKYRNETTQSYDITSLTATYVDIIFSYTTDIKGTPNVSSSPLFTSAEWIKGSDNTYTLRLHLRNKGAFYGYSVGWDKSRITFSFKNPTAIASGNKPLTGKRIVIDPGHGGASIGAVSGTVHEKTLTLKYALLLRDKLVSKGATVVMTRTGDTLPDNALSPPSMYARTNFARNNYTDLFISIHMNSATSSSARGYTIHYFNEYSFILADQIDEYAKVAYNKSGGASNRSQTVHWDPFNVTRLHDSPAVLLECGFMSNNKDMEMLISSTYQDNLTTELANAFVAYFNSISTIAGKTAVTESPTSTTTTTATVSTTTIVPAGFLALSRYRKKRRSR